METESESLYAAAFTQVQECGDIISSILIIYKFITENSLPIEFNAEKLRGIALRSADKDTSTYLWHINALIAASSDFEHLLLGIEMMFDRFLGNKNIFIKEKEKQKQTAIESISASSKLCKSSKAKHKFVGNEIISFVNSYYDQNEAVNEQKAAANHDDDALQSSMNISKPNEWKMIPQIHTSQNDENENTQNASVQFVDSENNKEYMKKYRGKISSPISFRMRQQKRMMQSGRKANSRNATRNTSVDLSLYVGQNFDDKQIDSNHLMSAYYQPEPEILSPFNVSKFAKKVDSMDKDHENQRLLQFER